MRPLPRRLRGLSVMPDRPVTKETGQIDSLERKNEKNEKGATFAMRFARSVAKSVPQIAAGPPLVVRNAEDPVWPAGTSWRSARDQAGQAGDRHFRTVFGEVRPDALRDPGALHRGSQQCSEAWTNVTAAETGVDSGTVACRKHRFETVSLNHACHGMQTHTGQLAEPCGAPKTTASGTKAFSFEQTVPVPSYLVTIAVGELKGVEVGPRSTVWSEPQVVDAAAWRRADR